MFICTPCPIENVRCLIFYNLKKLEPVFIILGMLYAKRPSFIGCLFVSHHGYLLFFAVFQDSISNTLSHVTALFVNMPFNKEDRI